MTQLLLRQCKQVLSKHHKPAGSSSSSFGASIAGSRKQHQTQWKQRQELLRTQGRFFGLCGAPSVISGSVHSGSEACLQGLDKTDSGLLGLALAIEAKPVLDLRALFSNPVLQAQHL